MFLDTYGSSGHANTTAQTMFRATDMSSGVFFDRYAAVEYAIKTTDSYGTLPLNKGIDDLGTFRMPEAQVSFICVSLKNNKFKMLLVLRALTILDTSPLRVRF